jgi:hypothetical protein
VFFKVSLNVIKLNITQFSSEKESLGREVTVYEKARVNLRTITLRIILKSQIEINLYNYYNISISTPLVFILILVDYSKFICI